MQNPDAPSEGACEVVTEFVRHRNVLLATCSLQNLFVEYYLHLAGHGLTVEAEHDRLFRRTLAAFVLHCGSRPRTEWLGWTLSFQRPPLNVFLTASNVERTVTGRVFTEGVKEHPENRFFNDMVRGSEPLRRSGVTFQGRDPLRAAETYYERSEQRPARFFDLGGDRYAMLGAHPDFDGPWLEGLAEGDLRRLAEFEHLEPIERRAYRWCCGCDMERIHRLLAPAMRENADGLFDGEEALDVQCPRCGGHYRVTREALEGYVARHPA